MPWDPGTATGLGPFPGVDPLEAARVVFSELPLPFLPELPARGVGADPVGRTAGLLADLHVEVGTGVWRFVPRGGRDEQRARTTLITDLDALEEVAASYAGPLKVRIVGPWSLVASIELAKGEKALADPGAVRDIAASLAEGLTRHLADIRRRLPAVTRLVVQVDEPLLPAVVAGELSTASGWGRLRSYERPVVEDGLRQVLRAGGEDAGVWLGSAALDGIDEDEIGEAIDAGVELLVACVPLAGPHDDPRPVMAPVTSLWNRLGFPVEQLSRTVAAMPVEGLEQIDAGDVPAVLKRTAKAAGYLDEFDAEESS